MAIRIRRQSGRPSAMQKLIESALYNMAEDLIAWQRTNGRVASGRSQDWRIVTNRFGNNEPKDIAGQLIGVRYINFALFGRPAGKQPRISVILRWMRQRGIKARDIKSGKFKTAEAAAHAIAFSIGEHGTQALKLSEPVQNAIIDRSTEQAIAEHLPEIADDTAEALIDQFREQIGNIKNVTIAT